MVAFLEPYERLEQEVVQWTGVKDAVACSSGTAALHLSLESLGLPQGSSVLIPDYTMVACARAVTLAGLTPVFVDVNRKLLLDHTLIDGACTYPFLKSPVRAVMAVHVYGRRCSMDNVHAVAREHGLAVVEDLAEAHGVTPHTSTHASCYSFYRNKVIAGEEGGCIGFADPRLALRARLLRCLGFTASHDFRHVPRGHNYRLANCLAKLILDSMEDFQENLEKRQEIEQWYRWECESGWRSAGGREIPWVYDVRIPGMREVRQDRVVRNLQGEGIAARHGFKRMSTLEEYGGGKFVLYKGDRKRQNEVAKVSQEVIYLPIQPGVTTQDDCKRAFKVIKKTLLEKVT